MSRWVPGRRVVMVLHRWLGVLSAVFLVILSLTGLALNHTERLGLDGIMIRNGLVLKRYGMEPGSSLATFRIGASDTITHLDGTLFHNLEPVGEGGMPVGTWVGDDLRIVATREELFLLTGQGELIEVLGPEQLPVVPVEGLGQNRAGSVLLLAGGRTWLPDPNWIEFSPYEGEFMRIEPEATQLEPGEARTLSERYRGEGISLYRLLLDLHSGRLFGLGGRLVMDLAALAVLVLVSSGLVGWKRRNPRSGP